jgi:HJR/Mrr/RecB family endonuclease
MDIGISFNDLFAGLFTAAAPLLFPFWLLAIPLSFIKRRRFALSYAIVAWILFFVLRAGMYVYGVAPSEYLIGEPLNSILFFVAGLLLIGVVGGKGYFQIRKIRGARSVKQLLALTPTEFEKAIERLYRSMGYKVTHSGKQGDHGVDLVVYHKNGEKWVVQCKQWKGQVGEPVVRDIYGAMHHAEAQGAAVVTTGSFSSKAMEWAEGKPIHLYDGEMLGKLLMRRKRR